MTERYGAHSPQHWLPRSRSGFPVLGVRGPPPATRFDQLPVTTVVEAGCSFNAQLHPLAAGRVRLGPAIGRPLASNSSSRD